MIVPLYFLFILGRDTILRVLNNLGYIKYGIESSNMSQNSSAGDKRKEQNAADSVVIHEANYDDVVPSKDVSSVVIKSPVAKDALYYNMSLKHRGKCVVFNHVEFAFGKEDREGSNMDVASIDKTFSKLGFEVKVHPNFHYKQIDDEISNLMQIDYTDYSCICIFVLSHGDAFGKVYSYDRSYPFSFIWEQFTADKCPTLGAKPKLFFTQACRGKKFEKGVPACSQSQTDSSCMNYDLPIYADFLIGHSTPEDHVSWRSPTDGSWYIQTLCEVIDKYSASTDLLKMLTITSRIVATSYKSIHDDPNKNGMVQVPTFTSTLMRDVYFAP